jgi:ABC-type polysaccharide/polyol phosphate transport system ATPase subunit
MALAILADRLAKRYPLGGRESYGALRDSLSRLARNPLSAFRRAAPGPGEWVDALAGVSFEIRHGEILGVIGRNGSGKSTLLKILSRVTEPTSGRAETHGRVGSLLEVGTGFHPELTGRENVFVNGAILGMRRAEIAAKFDEIVAFSGVERFIDTPVKHFSSGMQMRLGFAVAAHLEPEILLVDEVLAVGDVAFQRQCLGKMKDVSTHGRTVLLVSHQLNQIRRLCTRAIWLDGGRVRADGDVGETLRQYEAAVLDGSEALLSGQCFRGWEVAGGGHTVRTSDGPVTICVHVVVGQDIVAGHLGVSVYDDEDRIMAGWAFEPVSFRAGKRTLEVTVPILPLRPANYRLRFTLFDRGSNLTGGRLVESWPAVPYLALSVPPLSHPQDEYAGILNIPATLSGDDQAASIEAMHDLSPETVAGHRS